MKRSLSISIAILFASCSLSAQVYNMQTNNGQTINTCSGTLYDAGGTASSYGNNQNHTVTLCSNSPTNTQMHLYFNSFNVDVSDTLWIHDGATTAAPLIVSGNGINNWFNNGNSLNLFPVQSTTSGCLTLHFKSDGAGVAAGWDATVTCVNVCQPVFAGVDTTLTSPHVNDSNYIDVCAGDSVYFAGKGIYPQNGTVYQQTDATSTFIWDFGDGIVDTGQYISHLYTMSRGYDVQLTVIDSNGCVSTNAISLRVRLSDNPIKSVNPPPPICANESYHLRAYFNWPAAHVNLDELSYVQSASQRFDSTMFIPDGPNCPTQCYNTNVTFNNFLPGQTITSAADILSICVNMEHSFVGDLEFTIKCPNNQQAVLKTYINSGGAWMGAPLDGPPWDNSTFPCDPTMNQAGVGWNYCWSQTYPNIGTVNAHSSQAQLDSTNTVANTGYYLPDQGFNNLIGCPLNGTWNIEICDYWGIDNGYIFSWDLNLQPNLLPTNWGYEVDMDTIIWSGPYIDSVSAMGAYISPDIGGVFNYHFSYIDEFGCLYDTIVPVTVIDNPVVDLGPDTTICGGDTLTLSAGSGATGSFQWSNGSTLPYIYATTSGNYSLTITNSLGNKTCSNHDDINLSIYPAPAIGFFTDVYDGCEPLTVNFTDNTYPTIASYLWHFGDGNTSTQQSPSHTYQVAGVYDITVEATTTDGCYGEVTIPQLITVFATPDAALSANPLITNINTPIQFTNGTINGMFWDWDFGDGNGSTQQHPVHSYSTVATYTVWLYASTDHGCRDSASIEITIINDELIIPNIFTPNGDGFNDKFEIGHLLEGGYPTRYLAVFNRWGRKVYESSNYENDWDGEGLSDGVYYYVLDCKGLVRDFRQSGTVTIMRD